MHCHQHFSCHLAVSQVRLTRKLITIGVGLCSGVVFHIFEQTALGSSASTEFHLANKLFPAHKLTFIAKSWNLLVKHLKGNEVCLPRLSLASNPIKKLLNSSFPLRTFRPQFMSCPTSCQTQSFWCKNAFPIEKVSHHSKFFGWRGNLIEYFAQKHANGS